MDFMPTFLELAGARYPQTYQGRSITPYTGISLKPALEGKAGTDRGALFNEHFGARFARNADWKLVSLSGDTTWRLFRINDDETEMNDLAARNPQVVAELSAQWRQWALTHRYSRSRGSSVMI